MNITFFGAAKMVTGSCYLVETGDIKFLVDCGQFQGLGEEDKNKLKLEFDPKELDFILLTHAHIDHSGRIPLIVKNGFEGKIFATRPTVDLVDLLLKDSAHIHMEEANWENKKRKRAGLNPVEPLYTIADAFIAVQYLYPIKFDTMINIDDKISARYVDAGHLLGSASIEVFINEDGEDKKIVFSGDLGAGHNPLLNSPTMISSSDYLVVESTYGNRIHEGSNERIEKLAFEIEETMKRGGTVIIPSFAVGRTQEIIYDLKQHYLKDGRINDFLKIPIYIDSPLAINSTKVFEDNHIHLKKEISDLFVKKKSPLKYKNIRYLESIKESSSLNSSEEPKVLISASGMCEAGRIKHHLKHYLWRNNTTIIFVGYQGEGTIGRKIKSGEPTVELLKETIKINARIVSIEGFSGHADKEMLKEWIFAIKGLKQIIIVHGEDSSQLNLQKELRAEIDTPIQIPDLGDTITL